MNINVCLAPKTIIWHCALKFTLAIFEKCFQCFDINSLTERTNFTISTFIKIMNFPIALVQKVFIRKVIQETNSICENCHYIRRLSISRFQNTTYASILKVHRRFLAIFYPLKYCRWDRASSSTESRHQIAYFNMGYFLFHF